MAFSIPGGNQRSTKSRQKPQPFHWVGIDVSKPFFDAAVLSVPDRQTGVPVRELPVKRFPRTRAGAKKICGAARINIARGDGSLGDPRGDGIDGKVFERIGRLARRRALAVVRGDCESRTVAKFIQSLTLGNTADRLSAGALALYGAQRRPTGLCLTKSSSRAS